MANLEKINYKFDKQRVIDTATELADKSNLSPSAISRAAMNIGLNAMTNEKDSDMLKLIILNNQESK